MAWVAAILFSLDALAALKFPPLTGRVVDEAGLLSPEARTYLAKLLEEHETKTGNQVVVVTLSSLQEVPIEEYGYQLGRHWGIGRQGRDDGALLIVAPRERKVRIEAGYGLEGTLTDALSRDIIETRVTPEFRRNDYEKGIVAGTQAILATLEGEALAPPDRPPSPGVNGSGGSVFTLGFFLLVFGRFIASLFRSRALSSLGVGLVAFAVGTWFFNLMVGVILAVVLAFMTLSIGGRGGFPTTGFGGGGFRGGSRRGGGFSGGGGSFGGGGASGSW